MFVPDPNFLCWHHSAREQMNPEKIKPTLLLKNCLQAAAARIYDESADVNRATKRIEILLEWLPEDDSQETGFKLFTTLIVLNKI